MCLQRRHHCLILYTVSVLLILSGCGKFDRSKIAMPKMKFITSENLHSVICLNSNNVWFTGNHGTIYFSADGGSTWKRQETGLDLLLGDAAFVSKDEGWVVGVAGTILHTTDGGKTWQAQKSPTGMDLLDVFFLDAQHGWAVGEYGTVIHTDNGGTTWSPQMEPRDKHYNGVFFTDQNTGWVVGEDGTILHTEDGGKSWASQECKDFIEAVRKSGWDRPQPALYGMFFQDQNVGWLTGMDGVIIKTTDGGKNWITLPSGTDKPIYSILIKGNRGWAVGNKGIYLISEDGGNTWQVKDKAIKTKFWMRQLAFCDENKGFVVGATGTVATTTDGGNTWKIISGFSYEMPEFGLTDF
jgi:photosystem II stability/assembly factor-like uncharacterized protein